MSYHHLTMNARYHIDAYLRAGYKKKEIAKQLKVSPSTITRELQRNSGPITGIYFPIGADNYAKERSIKQSENANKKLDTSMKNHIDNYIKMDYSPEQVSATIKKKYSLIYSHVSIYKYLNQDRVNNGELYKHLRHQGKRRVKYGHRYKAGIKDRISISKRPEIVEQKIRIGDFEADTIIGAKQKGAIITIVDRKSMYLKMSNPTSKKADVTAQKIIELMSPFKEKIHTITTDNGLEFAEHKLVSKSLDCDYYFCHPYCSWERGLNENINGLIRQYIPKGSSFENITAEDIKIIEDTINHRPRKSLNWRTPFEVFHELEIAS